MSKEFKISAKVLEKLREKHGVSREEVHEAFLNRTGPMFSDDREDHRTDPPTMWFCSVTDRNRILKVLYVEREDFFYIKSAYCPTDGSDDLYVKLCAREGVTISLP
ncbi:DUF4258 domain-containing protein [Arenimonas sp. SCN 70-307]|uniref:DUF4258 domain-containing protein n=1 Tax=Arenimonas sp. SCN 70-307 TaxID=1660089 RepID=UPI0025B81A35|nr:DUF4258 domain-containing protein [Arenimonas sp. SCN 70-307]